MTRRILLPNAIVLRLLLVTSVATVLGCGNGPNDATEPEPQQAQAPPPEDTAKVLGPRTPILIQSGSVDVISDKEVGCEDRTCTFVDERGGALVHIVAVRAGAGKGPEKIEIDPDRDVPGPRTVRMWFGSDPPNPKEDADLTLDLGQQTWILQHHKNVECKPDKGQRKHTCTKGNTRIGHYARGGDTPKRVQHLAIIVTSP